jgi:uncharacterized membrane protein
MTKIKVIDLDKLKNLVVDNFFFWNHLVNVNYIWISQIWNSNFVNDLGWRNYHNESCRSRKVMKLCSWQLFIWNRLVKENYVWISKNLKFEFLNDLGWTNNKNKSCRSRKVMKFCSWQLFHLKSSYHGKVRLNFSNLKFKCCKRHQMEKLPIWKL